MAGKLGSSRTNDEELRIVIVGKTGTGKSATGNTILGHQCFESKFSAVSMSKECSKGKAIVDGQHVAVIDTPGLFDTRFGLEKTTEDVFQCISYASPGPHIFLVVIRLGRYTEEEKQTVQRIQKIFGDAADRYSMVLFTGGDLLEESPIEEFLEESPELQEVVARCNNQYHVFNNKLKERSQVTELLQKIREIVQNNGGSHYTNEMFQEAERAIEEEKERILREKEEEIQKEKEKIEREIQERYQKEMQNYNEQFQAERERERKEREEERKAEREMEKEEMDLKMAVLKEKHDRELKEEKKEREIQERYQKEVQKNNEQFQGEREEERKEREEERKEREEERKEREEEKKAESKTEKEETDLKMAELKEKHDRELKEEKKEREIQERYQKEVQKLQAERERDRKDREEERKKEREEREQEIAKIKEKYERELEEERQKIQSRCENEARDQAEKINVLYHVIKIGETVADTGRKIFQQVKCAVCSLFK